MGKTVTLADYAEATRKKPIKPNHPLSHSRDAYPPSSGEHADVVLVLALRSTPSSL